MYFLFSFKFFSKYGFLFSFSFYVGLFRKNGVSSENDLKDAASVCLPLLYAAIKDIKKEKFPKSCLLNVEIPTCPIANKV